MVAPRPRSFTSASAANLSPAPSSPPQWMSQTYFSLPPISPLDVSESKVQESISPTLVGPLCTAGKTSRCIFLRNAAAVIPAGRRIVTMIVPSITRHAPSTIVYDGFPERTPRTLPARQNAFPVRVHVLAHFRRVVPLAKRNFGVTFPAARQLVVVQLHPQTRTIRNRYAAVDELDAPANHNLVLFRLPGIVCIA